MEEQYYNISRVCRVCREVEGWLRYSSRSIEFVSNRDECSDFYSRQSVENYLLMLLQNYKLDISNYDYLIVLK